MADERSICPVQWNEYYSNVDEALDIIWASNLDETVKDKLEELLRVDTISAYPPPYFETPNTWLDAADIIDDICPKGASVAEVNWLKEQLEKLNKGTAL